MLRWTSSITSLYGGPAPEQNTAQPLPYRLVCQMDKKEEHAWQVHRKAGVVKGTNSAMMGSGPAGADRVSEEPFAPPTLEVPQGGCCVIQTVLFIGKKERKTNPFLLKILKLSFAFISSFY